MSAIYKNLYIMEKEQNDILRDKIFIYKEYTKSLEKENKELIQLVEDLKSQIAIQNVAPKEKLVERIIIETYEKYI